MLRSFVFTLAAIIAAPLYAHEFWIDPVKFQVQPGENIQADFKVGQGFAGGKQSYLSSRSSFTALVQNATLRNINPRQGDRPAMNFSLPDAGLVVLVQVTRNSTVNYTSLAKFEKFVTHKDFKTAMADHAARGLPDEGFIETYRRYAKSLVAVGEGAGQDVAIGLDIEIVALANPFTDDLSGGMPVQVLYGGKPRPNTQVEVFARKEVTSEEVEATFYRTDENGIATIAIEPGMTYMVDNVALEPRDGTGSLKAVWHTLWANLTFQVPN